MFLRFTGRITCDLEVSDQTGYAALGVLVVASTRGGAVAAEGGIALATRSSGVRRLGINGFLRNLCDFTACRGSAR